MSITLEKYTEKSVAVFGDTNQYKETLKDLGGKFNCNLKGRAGWIFPYRPEKIAQITKEFPFLSLRDSQNVPAPEPRRLLDTNKATAFDSDDVEDSFTPKRLLARNTSPSKESNEPKKINVKAPTNFSTKSAILLKLMLLETELKTLKKFIEDSEF